LETLEGTLGKETLWKEHLGREHSEREYSERNTHGRGNALKRNTLETYSSLVENIGNTRCDIMEAAASRSLFSSNCNEV
jgi:hypothetical protein